MCIGQIEYLYLFACGETTTMGGGGGVKENCFNGRSKNQSGLLFHTKKTTKYLSKKQQASLFN